MKRGPLLLVAGGAAAIVLGSAGLYITSRLLAAPALVSDVTTTILPSIAAAESPAASTPVVALPASTPPQPSPAPAARAVARISIPRIGIHNAPIYDRGTDSKGVMLIAPGYAVTHYAFSAPLGTGNAVLYGHDDIQGDIFGHLYDLAAGDLIEISMAGRTQVYRVTGHQIVPPTAVSVLNPTPDVRLTIITCWPFNVDTKRWIVTATIA